MKRKILLVFSLVIAIVFRTPAQTIVITDDSSYTSGNTSAVLDVNSAGKGFLSPRMTQIQRLAIKNPVEGLLVYQTDLPKGFYYYTNTSWMPLASGTGSQWITSGNNVYYNTGNIGIGTALPSTALQIVGTNPLTLTGVQNGTPADSILTIWNGVVRKLTTSSLVVSSNNAWSLVGNSGTLSNNYFLGTTNSDPLIIKVNNQLSGRLDAENTFLGYQSGYNNTAANHNTGIGQHSLFSITSGSYNTAAGYNSLPNLISGSYNIGLGYNADGSNSVSYTIGIGANTYTTGSNAIAIGTAAKVMINNGLAIGNNTYVSNIYGIAMGEQAKVQANNAISLGYLSYTGGTNAIALGNGTAAQGANSVAIGYNAKTYQDNSIVLGDINNNNVNVGIGTNSPGAKLHVIGNILTSGTVTQNSDARYKDHIVQLSEALDHVLHLRGVYYYWKAQEFPEQHFSTQRQIGLIAQEIEKIYPELVQTDPKGYKSVDYSRLTPVLTEAIKTQQKMIDLLKEQMEKQNDRLKQLEEKLNTGLK